MGADASIFILFYTPRGVGKMDSSLVCWTMLMLGRKWRTAGGSGLIAGRIGKEDQKETSCRAGSAPPRQQGEGENVTWGWVPGPGCLLCW